MYLQLKFGGKKDASTAGTQVLEREPVIAPMAVTPKANDRKAAGAPRIKTYVAEGVPQAMTLARRELGEDAILIQTNRRETDDPTKRFEVTFGVVPNGTAVSTSVKPPSAALAVDTEIARQLESLRRELAALQTMLRLSTGKSLAPPDNEAAAEAYAVLLGNDVDEDLALELVGGIEAEVESPAGALAAQLATQVSMDSSIGNKAVILMGPPASGKTTVLIKLAVEYGLKCGRPVEIFALSKGAGDRTLESMTTLLGVPFEALANAAALECALARPRAEGTLVLVDTKGFGSGTPGDETELASLLASCAKAEVHLVLPAAWHRVNIRKTIDRFEIFQPARLLFTMVDQAAVYGPMIQEARRTRKPLSFMSGTALESAKVDWLVERLYSVAREASGKPN
jgi:flagellar biosynthesis protein FlhF